MTELLIQNEKGQTFDASQIVAKISWTTHLEDNPGKLQFSLNDATFDFKEGAVVSLKVNSQNVFLGYVFVRKINDTNVMDVTCYDSMRYLQNKDTKVFQAITLSDTFKNICEGMQMKYRIVDNSRFNVPAIIHDNKTYYEMIVHAIDETLLGTGEWFYIQDNYGVLEQCALSQQITNLYIGDESLLTGFDYESSIDRETYNQVKIIQENQETHKRDVYMTRDSNNIKRWGLLQFFEKADENINEAQLKEKADKLLELYNRPFKSLKLKCLGDLRVRAGKGVTIGINRLKNEEIQHNQVAFVTQCVHDWDGGNHTMDITVRVVM